MTRTNIESSTSNDTSSDNENSNDELNMKMLAVVRKKFPLVEEQDSDTVDIDVPGDSDGTGSESLL